MRLNRALGHRLWKQRLLEVLKNTNTSTNTNISTNTSTNTNTNAEQEGSPTWHVKTQTCRTSAHTLPFWRLTSRLYFVCSRPTPVCCTRQSWQPQLCWSVTNNINVDQHNYVHTNTNFESKTNTNATNTNTNTLFAEA